MRTLRTEYDNLNQKAKLSKLRFKNREKAFTLFSFLDRLAGQAGLKDHVVYMKPSTSEQENTRYKRSMVETKLQALTLKQLMPFIYMVEASKNNVEIKRLSITQAGKNERFIDVVMQIETLEL